MFEFFDFISGLINTVWNAISETIASVVAFISHVVNGMMFISQALVDLPPFCSVFLTTIVSISLITMFISAFIDTA